MELGGGTLNFFFSLAQVPDMPGALPCDQVIDVVTVGPVAAESLLIEETLDAATQADLVGMFLDSYGPAHFLVPAAAQNRYRCTCQPSGHDTHWP